jgi:hypothetical protein
MNTEYTPDVIVSEMLRVTANNNNQLLLQIADHIDKLESHISILETSINKLKQQVINLENTDDYK